MDPGLGDTGIYAPEGWLILETPRLIDASNQKWIATFKTRADDPADEEGAVGLWDAHTRTWTMHSLGLGSFNGWTLIAASDSDAVYVYVLFSSIIPESDLAPGFQEGAKYFLTFTANGVQAEKEPERWEAQRIDHLAIRDGRVFALATTHAGWQLWRLSDGEWTSTPLPGLAQVGFPFLGTDVEGIYVAGGDWSAFVVMLRIDPESLLYTTQVIHAAEPLPDSVWVQGVNGPGQLPTIAWFRGGLNLLQPAPRTAVAWKDGGEWHTQALSDDPMQQFAVATTDTVRIVEARAEVDPQRRSYRLDAGEADWRQCGAVLGKGFVLDDGTLSSMWHDRNHDNYTDFFTVVPIDPTIC